MLPEPCHFEAVKTARYFKLEPERYDASRVLIALHGYGQLPQYFLKRFEPLLALGWTVIAPEGFHRFYREGTGGRVGASWMTKEDREADVQDYVRYLNQLTDHLELSDSKPTLLGFSQGVATAARWTCLGNVQIRRLICWAGVFPPDLDWYREIQPLLSTPIDVVLGDSDPYFNADLLTTTAKLFDEHSIPYRNHSYPGGHAVDSSVLTQLLSE